MPLSHDALPRDRLARSLPLSRVPALPRDRLSCIRVRAPARFSAHRQQGPARVDGELNGALLRCTLCEKERLKRPKGPNTHKLFVCESKDYHICAFTAEPSKVDRLPWRTPEEGRRPKAQDPAVTKREQALAELSTSRPSQSSR
jgi:hypothetical protein